MRTSINKINVYIIFPLITLYILENKANATFKLNIDSLKTAIEKEGNKISEKFILNVYRSL